MPSSSRAWTARSLPVRCSDDRLVRGVQYRAYRPPAAPGTRSSCGSPAGGTQACSPPTTSRSRRSRARRLRRRRPFFTEREVELLNDPNLAAYVVTAERAGRRLRGARRRQALPRDPAGHQPRTVTPEAIAAAAQRKAPGDVVVGYISAFMLTAGDRDGKARCTTSTTCSISGTRSDAGRRAPGSGSWASASDRVRQRIGGRDDIVLFGRMPRGQALAHTANFDIALYPRTKDEGIQAAKIAEYMGLGVPTVSYDFQVTEELRRQVPASSSQTPQASSSMPSCTSWRTPPPDVSSRPRRQPRDAPRMGRARAPVRGRDPRSLSPVAASIGPARAASRPPAPPVGWSVMRSGRSQPPFELSRRMRPRSCRPDPDAGDHRRDREGGVRGMGVHPLVDDDSSGCSTSASHRP